MSPWKHAGDIFVSTDNKCMYKGRQYVQNEKWVDGCDYECVCEDSSTGFYRCYNRWVQHERGMTLTFRQLPEVSLLSTRSWACSAILHHQHQHQHSIRSARANWFEVKANCTKHFIIISLETVICRRISVYLRWCLLLYYQQMSCVLWLAVELYPCRRPGWVLPQACLWLPARAECTGSSSGAEGQRSRHRLVSGYKERIRFTSFLQDSWY